MNPDRYNLRVYGIWINGINQVLLTEERRNGYEMVKFPGGGLEFGEGLADSLRREWREELDLEIQVGRLFYINDFLQISAFNPRDQLLSVYYLVEADEAALPSTHPNMAALPPGPADAQTFRWVDIRELKPQDLTFPIDRVVAEMLRG
jgi:8-oxo-dGTP diphosphatase